ncbi:MAG: glycosyltransferase family 4 protein [Acidobacteriaceae bacterium]
MRIAFVCGFAWEPKGTLRLRAFPLAVQVARLGHEVTIITVPYDNPADSGRSWKNDGVGICNVKVSGSAFSYPAALLRMVQRIRKFAPDVVHIVKPKGFAGATAVLLRAMTSLPIVTDCDDWEGWGGWNEVKPYPWLVKQFIDWMERSLMRRSAALTVASRTLFERSVALRGGEAQTVYVPNCLSTSQIEKIDQFRTIDQNAWKAELGFEGRRVVLYAGHYEPGDDLFFFARAAAEVSEQTGAVIVFVGEGTELRPIKDFFACRPKTTARFLGQLSYDDYLRALSACDVAAFPYPDTLIYRAKCSVRIVEYMAMGKPVLTTRVGQNVEYIQDGISGSVGAPGDHAGFVERLKYLVRKPEQSVVLGRNARNRVLERFVWEANAGSVCEQVYRSVTRRPGGFAALERIHL